MGVRFNKKTAIPTCAALGGAAVVALLLGHEAITSHLQASYLAGIASESRFWVGPGPSSSIRFTKTGPYDHRLGYADLPAFLERLNARGYEVAEQARISPAFAGVMDRGLFAPYREKVQAGLSLLDCRGEEIFTARYPENVYPTFDSIPRVLVDSLLFIENRELFDGQPTRNPAVEWDRFARAVLERILKVFDPEHNTPGGSTLATQIEKYRHSPDGMTGSGKEKLRQMFSASLRAYLDGEETFAARRRIVLDYINTVPLSARPGVGEINGLPDGLRAWYGRDYREVSALLMRGGAVPLKQQALAFKQALSLIVAQRRPSYYLLQDVKALDAHTNRYLRLLASAGIISSALRNAALAHTLELQPAPERSRPTDYASRKAAFSLRSHLASMLQRPVLYDLDRLDLTAVSTLDSEVQRSISAALGGLSHPAIAKAFGLLGPHMLKTGDPSKVTYSFTLYERTHNANVVRVQADNLDQPLDVNEDTKLDLGSTAKLRTLVTYLEMVAELHRRFHERPAAQLRKVEVAQEDAITRWALDYLAAAKDRTLEPMLEAALERRYSASPHEGFFTGGGLHHFGNFDKDDDERIMTVREAMRRSVNLVFIRLMRDIVHHEMFRLPDSGIDVLKNPRNPVRQQYLTRFADSEGADYLRRFYAKYFAMAPEEIADRLARRIHPTRTRLAVIFRTVLPEAGPQEFADYLRRHLPKTELPTGDELEKLHTEYAADRFSLSDRGYLSRVHPLLLWLVEYRRQHPQAALREVLETSRAQRLAAYVWLFKSPSKSTQDRRIRTLLEADAFAEIQRRWARLGYPFGSLVPSFATALGASADRPAALAELMGILVNDGVRLPTVRIQSLHFATHTPYETRMDYHPVAGERVLPREVARVVRRTLADVVEDGTARRLKGTFVTAGGEQLEVGGKTGTGDHRYQTFDRNGRVLTSRVVARAGTFAFHIGERYFGVITAYVRGPEAEEYEFTSGLTVQVLKMLAPALVPLTAQIGTIGPGRCSPMGRGPIMASREAFEPMTE